MPRGRPKKSTGDPLSSKTAKVGKPKGNGANLGFEARLFLAANKLGKNLAPSDYKHVALGLIFLKHISRLLSQGICRQARFGPSVRSSDLSQGHWYRDSSSGCNHSLRSVAPGRLGGGKLLDRRSCWR
jgi:hypothetical protein